MKCQSLESETNLTLRYILCLSKTLSTRCVIPLGKLHLSGTSRKIKQTLKVVSNINLTSTSTKPPNYAVSLDSVKSLRLFQERWCNRFACFNLLGMPDGWSLPYQDWLKTDFHFHILLSKLNNNFDLVLWGKPHRSGMYNWIKQTLNPFATSHIPNDDFCSFPRLVLKFEAFPGETV